MSKQSLEKYDKNMRANSVGAHERVWHSPHDTPFGIFGLAWFAEENIYRRLPKSATGFVPEAVDHLANLYVRGTNSISNECKHSFRPREINRSCRYVSYACNRSMWG